MKLPGQPSPKERNSTPLRLKRTTSLTPYIHPFEILPAANYLARDNDTAPFGTFSGKYDGLGTKEGR